MFKKYIPGKSFKTQSEAIMVTFDRRQLLKKIYLIQNS